MNERTLRRLASRGAAVALLIAVLALAYLAIVAPLRASYDSVHARIAEARQLLSRFETLARSSPAADPQAEGLQQPSADELYLSGSTDALAAVALQERAKSEISTEGGLLKSIQVLSTQTEGELRKVGIRLQMTGTAEPLYRIIYALETGTPLLFVDNLLVQSRLPRAAAFLDDAEPMLSVSFDLAGYMPPEPS